MFGWRNQNQVVFVDKHRRQSIVIDRHRDHSEIDRIIDHRFQDLGVVRPADANGNVGILLLEMGKDLGKDVQARALIRADHNFSAWHAFSFRNRYGRGFACVERFFCEL